MNGKDARSLSAEAQEALRMRAVDYYLACGNKSQTARAFGVSRQAVTDWARRSQHSANIDNYVYMRDWFLSNFGFFWFKSTFLHRAIAN
jgi:DNA invertase Pin-like site-specific DNA recombinase